MEDNSFLIKLCDSRIAVIKRTLKQFRSKLDAPDEGEVLPLCFVTYVFLHAKDELYLLIRANQKAVEVEESPELYSVLKLQISEMLRLLKELIALEDELKAYLFCPAIDEV